MPGRVWPIELQMKVREEFTIMEKSLNFCFSADIPISHLQGVYINCHE